MEVLEVQQVYEEALKLGKHCWNQKVFRGESGYLKTLDSMLEGREALTEYPLGLVEIPLKKIIGTYTHGRSVSFAENFMPLMNGATEFASKWMHLYKYHMETGIADPIKVYEYLNHFFVIEGNKRVSVLKFVEGTHINGQVIRILPKQNPQDKMNTIYYEFVKFYSKTKINEVWFSEVGRFPKLLEYIQGYEHKLKKIKVDTEDLPRIFLANCYRPFRTIYYQLGGDALEITTGDAFLTFLQLFDLPEEITLSEHRAKIKQVINELSAIDLQADHVETEAIPQAKKTVLSTLTKLVTPKKILKVAFVYAKSSSTSGWTYAHELGRLHIENQFKDQIHTDKIENVPESEKAGDILEALAQKDYDIIFCTSPTFLAPALKVAMNYKNVKFFNCAMTHSYPSLTLYFGRIHEPRYLQGMIAGAMTQTNLIGYVAPFPTSDVVSSINAFTLGAQAVNPYVKIKAVWTNCWDNPVESRKKADALQQLGVDIISNEDWPIPGDMTKEYGLYHIDSKTGEKTHLAMAIWNWGLFYEQVIQSILSGTLKTYTNEDVPINYWQGINNGIVDVLYSNRHINFQMKQLIETVKHGIETNNFQIFTGPIYDQNHQLKVKADSTLIYEDIIHMDWLVEGIEGEIPNIESLTPINPLSFMEGLAH